MDEIKFLDKYFKDLKVLLSNQNYFPKSTPTETLTEEGNGNTQDIDISDAMAAYTSAIKRSAPYMKDANAEPFKNVKN